MKEKLVYIIIIKLIEGDLILILIVINYVINQNVMIKNVIILTTKSNKFIIQVDINLNFASPTITRIIDANINNFVLLLILKLKLKFK